MSEPGLDVSEASELVHRVVRTNGISMHVAEQGTGPPVILCHGFPELWYSWRHQLPALAAAGYRAVAPDQRGYGETDRPQSPLAYDAQTLGQDLLGLLDDLGEERAVFVGHDWGAILAWWLAIVEPERVAAVAALSVPFVPPPPLPPTQLIRAVAGHRFHYILYFQERGRAERELEADPRRALARIFWSNGGEAPKGTRKSLPREGTGYLDVLEDPPALPAWLTEEDLDVYAGAFSRTGFSGPLEWYRNFDRNWELIAPFAHRKVSVPALFVSGDRDPVRSMIPPEAMDGWVLDLRIAGLLPGCGHWTQQERPEAVNELLVDFLRAVVPSR